MDRFAPSDLAGIKYRMVMEQAEAVSDLAEKVYANLKDILDQVDPEHELAGRGIMVGRCGAANSQVAQEWFDEVENKVKALYPVGLEFKSGLDDHNNAWLEILVDAKDNGKELRAMLA
jgi:hypothetical protein